MNSRTISSIVLTVLLGAAACENNTSPNPASDLVADSTITDNVAVTAGDAIATSIAAMVDNENAATLGSVRAASRPAFSDEITVARTVTCYDAAGGEVVDCSPLSSVKSVVAHVALNGSRNGTVNRDGKNIAVAFAVHRVADDTTTRNFTGDAETSRTHDALGVAHDTATFTSEDGTLQMAEAAHDTFDGVTFDLPHANNPWPSAGTVTRVDTVHVEATQGSNTDSRTVIRNISVQFPADNQGNVTITIGGETSCTLNLVTHVVNNCQ